MYINREIEIELVNLIENYIATVLKKYGQIYTYRKAKTEISFICENEGKIYAHEVKSGSNTKSKSLAALVEKNKDVTAIKLTRENLNINQITNIPLYAIDIILKDKMLDKLL